MKRLTLALTLLGVCLWPLTGGSYPTVGNTGGGNAGVEIVTTKAGLEEAAETAAIENKVILVTEEISSSTYTGTDAVPAAADGGDTDTINDATYDFTTQCGGASCDLKYVCIVDGGTPVASPEGECRQIATGTSAAGTFDVANAFSSAIVAGTYYVIIDPILLAPYLTGAGKDVLRVECGDGGFFSAGGAGAGVIMQLSLVNVVVDASGEYNFDYFVDISHCKFQGANDDDAYEVGLFITDNLGGSNFNLSLDDVHTYDMNLRNADPQTIRTGGSSVMWNETSNAGTLNFYANESVFDAQVPLMLRTISGAGAIERSNLIQTALIDGDQSEGGGLTGIRDPAMVATAGNHTWNGVQLEYVSGVVFSKFSTGTTGSLDWTGGWWFFPLSSYALHDKAIVGAGDGATNATATATAGGLATITDTTETMVANEHTGRWVVLRPGDYETVVSAGTEEWREILSNTADPADTITVANNWDNVPQVGEYYKVYEWWDRAFFVANDAIRFTFNGIPIIGGLRNGEDPIIFNPLISYDSDFAAANGSVSVQGMLINQGCGITGGRGNAADPGDHTLIVAGEGSVTPIAGVNLEIVRGYDSSHTQDSVCNNIVPFGPSVDFRSDASGYVKADGKTWQIKSGVVSNVSPSCTTAYTTGTILPADLQGCLMTEDGAGAGVVITLTAAVEGQVICAANVDGNNLDLDPDAGDAFVQNEIAAFANGDILRLATAGDSMCAKANADGNWQVFSVVGAYTDQN